MLLLDADSVIYAAGFSNQVTVVKCLGQEFQGVTDAKDYMFSLGLSKEEAEAEMEKTVTASPISHGITSLNNMLAAQVKRAGEALGWRSPPVKYYLTGEGNFRDSLYKEYKANRKDVAKPVMYEELRDYLLKDSRTVLVSGMEADDQVSIELYQDPECSCIVSIDKDLLNTPGYNFNPKHSVLQYIEPEQANDNFLLQLLTGDYTDNIPGLPKCTPEMIQKYSLPKAAAKGCGEGTAARIYKQLQGNHVAKYSAINDLYNEYKEYFKDEPEHPKRPFTDTLTNAKLLWMIRETDVNGNPRHFSEDQLLLPEE